MSAPHSPSVSVRQLWGLIVCSLLTATHSQSYYTVSRGGYGGALRSRTPAENGLLDSLQRGHEGLMVKLDNLNKAIKEDELKLNNVFYKLGRHDTDIQKTTAVQTSLVDSSRKLEAKLNKQSYNVDFLRRHVAELKRGVRSSTTVSSTVDDLKSTVAELQMSLAKALYRTELLENKTSLLQNEFSTANAQHYSPGIDDNNIYYSSRTPKTTYYYLNSDSIDSVCPESSGWVSVVGGGCWWIGEESHSFMGAIAACTRQGGILGQLPPSKDKWPEPLKKRITESSSSHFWTSGTDAFTPGEWQFLFSGSPVTSDHWATDAGPHHPLGSLDLDCAVMTSGGLEPASCAMRYHFVCEKLPSW